MMQQIETRDEIIKTYVEKLAALDQEIVSEHEERVRLQRDYENSKARGSCMNFQKFDDLCSTDSECTIELVEHSQLAIQLVEEGACNPTDVSPEFYIDQPGNLQEFHPYMEVGYADCPSEVGTVDSQDRHAMNMMNITMPFCTPTAVVPAVCYVPTMTEVLVVPQTFEAYQPYTGQISEYSESIYSLGPTFLARQSSYVTETAYPVDHTNMQNMYIEPNIPEVEEETEAEILERARKNMIQEIQTKVSPRTIVIKDKTFKKGQRIQFFWRKKWHDGKVIKYRKNGYIVRSQKHQKNIHRFSEMMREPIN